MSSLKNVASTTSLNSITENDKKRLKFALRKSGNDILSISQCAGYEAIILVVTTDGKVVYRSATSPEFSLMGRVIEKTSIFTEHVAIARGDPEKISTILGEKTHDQQNQSASEIISSAKGLEEILIETQKRDKENRIAGRTKLVLEMYQNCIERFGRILPNVNKSLKSMEDALMQYHVAGFKISELTKAYLKSSISRNAESRQDAWPDVDPHICWNPNSAIPTAIKAAMQLNDRRFSNTAKMRGKTTIDTARDSLNMKRARKASESNLVVDNIDGTSSNLTIAFLSSSSTENVEQINNRSNLA